MRSNLWDFWPLMKNFLHRSLDFVPTCRRIILKSLPKDDTAWRKAAFSSSVHSQVPSSISQQVMSGGYRLLAWQRFVASGERESHISINASTATLSLSSDFLQRWSLPERVLWLTAAPHTIAGVLINFFCESTFALRFPFLTQSLHGSCGCFWLLTFTTHLLLLFLLIFL